MVSLYLPSLALLGLLLLRVTGTERGTLLVLLVGALPLTLLPAYPLLAVGLVLRQRLLAALSAAAVAGHLLVVAPALSAEPLPDAARTAPTLRVVTANVYRLNPVPRQAGAVLRALAPDVLVVPELDADGLAGLRASGLLEDLPHAVVDLSAREETVGLFSRLPLTDVGIRQVGGRALPRATVDVGSTPVRLLTAHPLPPISVLAGAWRTALADLAGEVRGQDLPVVLAGDLNATRDHAPFRELLATGLRDAHDSRGRGLARTWPASFPVLLLDHVLVRDGGPAGLAVTAVREQQLPGSDHLAVVADIAVRARSANAPTRWPPGR